MYNLTDLNPYVAAMRPSATLAVSARAKALKREGRDIIELSAGEPDFPTPQPIVEAAHRALDEGHFYYTANAGLPELREAIAVKLQQDNGLEYDPEAILCTNGAKQAVAQAILAICRPGDEVLLPAPFWVSYSEMVRLAGAEPKTITTSPQDGYRLQAGVLEAAITDRTRLLVLNSPSNPTGAVLSRSDLESIAEVLRRHPQVFILSDEIYEYVVFDADHHSIGSFDGLFDRVITVNGFSKGYSMTGWRLGYMAGPEWIVRAADTIQSQLTSAPNTVVQRSGLAALAMDRDPIAKMVAAFRDRRDAVLGRLHAIEGLECPSPDGAFYLFPDVTAFFGRRTSAGAVIDSSQSLCLYLLESCGVALVPGEAFGTPTGMRLSYAASVENLMAAADRIESGLANLSAPA